MNLNMEMVLLVIIAFIIGWFSSSNLIEGSWDTGSKFWNHLPGAGKNPTDCSDKKSVHVRGNKQSPAGTYYFVSDKNGNTEDCSDVIINAETNTKTEAKEVCEHVCVDPLEGSSHGCSDVHLNDGLEQIDYINKNDQKTQGGDHALQGADGWRKVFSCNQLEDDKDECGDCDNG